MVASPLHPRRVALALLCTLVALTGFASAAGPNASALGPAPRTAEGRYTNSAGALSHGSLSVRIPFFGRRFLSAFRNAADAPARMPNDGRALLNPDPSAATVTWIGHATVLVQIDGLSFLTDPIWSDTPSPVSFAGPKRFVAPGIAMDDLPQIDFVVISHNHYDHLDIPSLVALADRNPNTRFFVPKGNAKLLRKHRIVNVEPLDWGQVRTIGPLAIYCLPAQHWSKRSLNDDNDTLWSSWAVVGAEKRIFFAGDTGYFPGFAAIRSLFERFDLALLPIGAYSPTAMMRSSHLNPEEAIDAALDLNARHVLAMHFGTFDLSDEPLREPPARFRAAAQKVGLDDTRAWLVRIGETRNIP